MNNTSVNTTANFQSLRKFVWPQIQKDGSVNFIVPDAQIKNVSSGMRSIARKFSIKMKVKTK